MKNSSWKMVCLAILLLLVSYYFLSPKDNGIDQNSITTQVAQQTIESSKLPEKEKPENWRYLEKTDKMGRHIKMASTSSINSLFENSSLSAGFLHLRIHTQYGKGIMLGAGFGGEFSTDDKNCKVLVRFDEGKPEWYKTSKPSDDDADTLFIQDYSKFVAQLKNAKKVLIEAPFYNKGKRILEFNVEGLKWESNPPKKKKSKEIA